MGKVPSYWRDMEHSIHVSAPGRPIQIYKQPNFGYVFHNDAVFGWQHLPHRVEPALQSTMELIEKAINPRCGLC